MMILFAFGSAFHACAQTDVVYDQMLFVCPVYIVSGLYKYILPIYYICYVKCSMAVLKLINWVQQGSD